MNRKLVQNLVGRPVQRCSTALTGSNLEKILGLRASVPTARGSRAGLHGLALCLYGAGIMGSPLVNDVSVCRAFIGLKRVEPIERS